MMKIRLLQKLILQMYGTVAVLRKIHHGFTSQKNKLAWNPISLSHFFQTIALNKHTRKLNRKMDLSNIVSPRNLQDVPMVSFWMFLIMCELLLLPVASWSSEFNKYVGISASFKILLWFLKIKRVVCRNLGPTSWYTRRDPFLFFKLSSSQNPFL